MERYIEGKRWPTRYDYDIALENLAENMLDPELRQGKLERSRTGQIVHRGRPGTRLYRIDNSMIRCFCDSEEEAEDDIIERYQKLSDFWQKNATRISALIPIYYVKKGLIVDFFKYDEISGETVTFLETRVVPFIKMPFIRALPLNGFIAINHQNSQKMRQLSDAWVRMISEMEVIPMAHGDLDLTNVLVVDESSRGIVTLKLIDYDNVWIPEFASSNYQLLEYGHESFQHSAFFGSLQVFNETIDHFASLIIYISLQVLIDYPELYEKWNLNDHRLLFTPSDYQAEQRGLSGRISQLRHMHVVGLQPYIDELSACLRENRFPKSITNIANQSHSRKMLTEETVDSPYTYNPYEIRIADWDHAEYFSHRDGSLQ